MDQYLNEMKDIFFWIVIALAILIPIYNLGYYSGYMQCSKVFTKMRDDEENDRRKQDFLKKVRG